MVDSLAVAVFNGIFEVLGEASLILLAGTRHHDDIVSELVEIAGDSTVLAIVEPRAVVDMSKIDAGVPERELLKEAKVDPTGNVLSRL